MGMQDCIDKIEQTRDEVVQTYGKTVGVYNDTKVSEANASNSAGDSALSALQSESSANFKGDWVSGASNQVGESRYYNGNFYRCAVANSDTTFDESKWRINVPMGAVGNIMSPLLDLPLKNSLGMKAGVGATTFTRASTATYIDRYGVLKTAAVDEPRFEKEGLLIEGSSTNIILDSDTINNLSSNWGEVYADQNVISTTEIAIDGNPTATKVAIGSGGSDTGHYQNVDVTANSTNTFSCWFRKDSNVEYFRLYIRDIATAGNNTNLLYSTETKSIYSILSTGTHTNPSARIDYETDEWIRISVTATVGSDTNVRAYVLSQGGIEGNYIVSGNAQIEELPFATSYIPTTTTPATRSSNILNVIRGGNVPNVEANGEITVAFDIISIGNTSGNQWVYGLHSDSADSLGLFFQPSGSLSSRCASNTSSKSISYSGIEKNKSYHITQVINTKGNTLFINGAQVAFIASGDNKLTETQNSTLSQLRIGSYNPTVTTQAHQFFGHISNLKIYDRSLTATEVALLAGGH